MFCGRETYTSAFAEKFVDTGLLRHSEEVDQAVSELLREGFLLEIKFEKGKGRPKIRTADLKPLHRTLTQYGLAGTVNELETYLKPLDKALNYFPKYVAACLPMAETTVRNLRWTQTLIFFCQFISIVPVIA